MRYRVCVVLGLLSFASPAGAQDMSQHWVRCLNEQEAFTADQSIEGCTAVIQAARDVPANMAIAFNSRGNSHAAKDQPDRAIEDYDQAIRLNPNYAAPHHNRGGVYLDRAQYDRAIQDYDQAIGLDPSALVFSIRGTSYSAKYDRAIQDFDQALRLKPNEAVLLSGRCYAKASAGALAAALADCNEALRRMPGHAEFLDSRGFTYLKMRQLPQALADYDAAFKVDPGRRPPCSDAASCAARWAMCRAATPTSPPPSRSMPRLPGGWRAAASFRERSPSTSEPDASKPLAGQSDNGHTAPGGGVAGSRPASPWRTRCLS
jgi:tetratricopeptide (TPR) repeat protein